MTEHFEIVVLGGGLAGRMAALAAAEETASVGLVSRSESTLRSSTGCIDVLGSHPDKAETIANPFDVFDSLPDDHPYRIIGEAGIREGLELFDSIAGVRYRGQHTDRNALLTSQLGTMKPTARYPRSFAPGFVSRDEETLIVGLESLAGIDGEFIASELSRSNVPFEVRGVNVNLVSTISVENSRLRIANALDRNVRWPGDDTPIRDRFARLIAEQSRGDSRIGVPAILGRTNTEAVRTHLEDEVAGTVFEFPIDPPSLPGIRLADDLDDELDSVGIQTIEGVEISDYSQDTGAITEVRTNRFPTSIRAEQFVLATGGLIGGGIEEADGTLSEPIFDLNVNVPGNRAEWIDPNPLGPQPFAEFGLVIDDRLRPTENASPCFENLRACGSILGGGDFFAQQATSGVSIATGVQAGRIAAEEVGR